LGLLLLRLLESEVICGGIHKILLFKFLVIDSVEKIKDICMHILVVPRSIIIVFLKLPNHFFYLIDGVTITDHVIDEHESLLIVDVPFKKVR